MTNMLALIRCSAGNHALNRPFTWTADGRRYARQVCTRPGCRHWRTWEVVRRHRPPAPMRSGRRNLRFVLGVESFAWPRAWTLALAVLAGAAIPTIGDVIRLGIGA